MAKRHGKKHTSKKRRHYQKRKQERDFRAKTYRENYYRQQAAAINNLKPIAAAARRFRDRTVEIEREIRNAIHTESEQ